MDADGNLGGHQADAGEKAASNAVVLSKATGMDAAKDDADRNAVFSSLVQADGDIVGLVAYSIYKQNKVDWLNAFQKVSGRAPTEQELNAYIIGESTPRRLATYRQLAGATLTGAAGPEAAADGAWLSNLGGLRAGAQSKPGSGWIVSSVLSYAILAAAILIGVWLVARYGLPSVRS
jgi:hypothetical protein